MTLSTIAHPGRGANRVRARETEASALQALTGVRPTELQLALMEQARIDLMLSDDNASALSHPLSRASTFHAAGHIVANAVLYPLRSIATRGFCDFYGSLEPHREVLARKAMVMLAGPAAEGYATGSFRSHPSELIAFSFISSCLQDCGDSATYTAILNEMITVSVLGLNWPVVETVEEALRMDRSVKDILNKVRAAMTTDGDRTSSPHKVALDKDLHSRTKSLIDLAAELADAREEMGR